MTTRLRWLDRPPLSAIGLVWPGRLVRQASGPSIDAAAPTVRVVTANALYTNRRIGAWAGAIRALEPDVLCVQELTGEVAVALAGCLPHTCLDVRPGSAGTGVWSREPIVEGRVVETEYRTVVTRLASGLTVVAAHALAPSRPDKVGGWLGTFDVIEHLAATADGPLVVAGDLNATFAHGPLRHLLAGGRLRDAHVDVGRPRARTWPARVPTALLDHVLVSPDVAVRSVTEHRLPGSDHRAVAATLAVAPPGS